MSQLEEVSTADLEKQIDTSKNSMILSENEDNYVFPGDEMIPVVVPPPPPPNSTEENNDSNNDMDYERHSNSEGETGDEDDEKYVDVDVDVDDDVDVDVDVDNDDDDEENSTPQNIKIPTDEAEMLVSDDEEEEELSSDDEDSDVFQKLDNDINKDVLMSHHPESQFSSYNEILALCKIVRDKSGKIIDPLHTTVPFLTKYEMARVLGVRAKQLNNGSDPFITTPNNIIEGAIIAEMELREKKLPFIIRRPLPNGSSEYWKIEDLEVLSF